MLHLKNLWDNLCLDFQLWGPRKIENIVHKTRGDFERSPGVNYSSLKEGACS
ncbi:hypothetical protein NEPTK9_001628 [Candidatus Neptunochlamydia vexilliferae]|uniref:Uncharacterized protein n=1 Tax=Candidatus Neptunichlamydia vexilliferae TaxID=1651774 RepID=A0ABS0B3C9_9BACT|nr:hypothetical protein [Candidatus Neptunochlamydia vexilliferae]